jgi:hypothetical protein
MMIAHAVGGTLRDLEMVVWGGFVNADAAQTSSGARYSPQLNRWLPTGIASTSEASHRCQGSSLPPPNCR